MLYDGCVKSPDDIYLHSAQYAWLPGYAVQLCLEQESVQTEPDWIHINCVMQFM